MLRSMGAWLLSGVDDEEEEESITSNGSLLEDTGYTEWGGTVGGWAWCEVQGLGEPCTKELPRRSSMIKKRAKHEYRKRTLKEYI